MISTPSPKPGGETPARSAGGPSAYALGVPRAALAEVRRFLGAVQSQPETEDVYRRHLRILHALDHLERLARLQALQWVDRAVYHLSRAADHLSRGAAAEQPGVVEP